MIVVASANGDVGIDACWDMLDAGGSALDAVEAGTRAVEDNVDDHTVGYGGYPNITGQVELDASIMDGSRRRAGAVGALRGYRHAITVARAVMERLPHVLVVGDGAALLARELGLEPEDLLTAEAERMWQQGLNGLPQSGDPRSIPLVVEQVRDVIGEFFDPERARIAAAAAAAPAPGGTVNFLAMDSFGHLASAVSTSGWAWKYPGRLGDSPVIGAGNYCDDRYGAAACTGWGELTMRAGTARTVVSGLAHGLSPEQAATAAVRDLADLELEEPGGRGYVNLIALDAIGRHTAVTTKAGTQYVWRADGMTAAVREHRTVVAVPHAVPRAHAEGADERQRDYGSPAPQKHGERLPR